GHIMSGTGRDGLGSGGRIADGTTTTLVPANYIGITLSGHTPLGNADAGVAIIDSPNNTVGGTVVVATGFIPRNVISANKGHGVYIAGLHAENNLVLGNFIGLDETGTAPLGNGAGVFIEVDARHNAIGGGVVIIDGK